jgi:hypothetical protein
MTNIKDVKLNDKIKFNNHFHTITNYEIDCSNMKGEVVDISSNNDRNYKYLEIEVKLESDKHCKDLEEWENCLIFVFPDDDHYNNVEVEVIKEKED